MIAPIANHPETLLDAMRHFTPEAAAVYVASIKWPTGPCCCKCGSTNVGTIKSRNRYQCREKGCRAQFSLITDTIMESTHLSLDKWCVAVWMIVACRNGVSSWELSRTLGCKQQSAWHLLHRVRHLFQQENADPMGQRGGVVEADWTYIGGVLANMSHHRRERARQSKNYGKAIVHAIKERRSGTVRAAVIPSTQRKPIRAQIRGNVAPNARLYTDSAKVYSGWSWKYKHKSVAHRWKQYVVGTVHTNGCENFFNCLRRGLKGTYVNATPEHLPAYVDEQVFRFNHRKLADWERFDGAMRMIVGKRLTYSELTDGAVR